jgi:hypothetical protein
LVRSAGIGKREWGGRCIDGVRNHLPDSTAVVDYLPNADAKKYNFKNAAIELRTAAVG